SCLRFLVTVRRPRRHALFPYTTLFRSIELTCILLNPVDDVKRVTHVPDLDICTGTRPSVSHTKGDSRKLSRQRSAHRCPSMNSSDRKSTRLNSSHVKTSYAAVCLKKQN